MLPSHPPFRHSGGRLRVEVDVMRFVVVNMQITLLLLNLHSGLGELLGAVESYGISPANELQYTEGVPRRKAMGSCITIWNQKSIRKSDRT